MQRRQRSALQNRRKPGVLAALFIAAGLGLSACAPPPAIALPGPRGSADALIGEWDGSYSGPATGRSGSIWFKLVAGEDHAHGDVLMKAQGSPSPYFRRAPGISERELQTQAPAMLAIHLVRVSGNQVDGFLDAYWDPLCNCEALTTFNGELFENRISGFFVTRLAGDAVATGRWEVTRRKPSVK